MADYKCLRGEAISIGNQGPVPGVFYVAPRPAKLSHASFFFGVAAVGTVQITVERKGVLIILKEISKTWDGPLGVNLQPADAVRLIVITPGVGNIDVTLSIDEHNYD